jgi:4-hydroxy-3-methylbut-2-enyl diphosphate reductase
MNVYIAAEAGFCFGVKRALNIIRRVNEEEQGIHVYGQLIHNTTVLEDLKKEGIDTITCLDQLIPGKKLAVRTHGIPKHEEDDLKNQGIEYVDATCPLVKKLHHIIEKIDETDTRIVIIGDKNHPEITAAQSYAQNAVIVDSESDIEKIKKSHRIAVIGQTTLDTDHFKKMVSLLVEKADKLEVYNTICNATIVRQQAVRQLAPKVDVMVVLGNKNSSNTRKLFNIASRINKNTFYIEKSSELNDAGFIEKIKDFRSAGIAAGASTPPAEIQNAKNILENITRVKEINHGKRKRNSSH